jgi:hypothetical protein
MHRPGSLRWGRCVVAARVQCALGGNALTTIVACVNPSASFRAETKRTLDFAGRATKVQNRVGGAARLLVLAFLDVPNTATPTCQCAVDARTVSTNNPCSSCTVPTCSCSLWPAPCVQAVRNLEHEGNAQALAAEVARLQKENAALRTVTAKVGPRGLSALAGIAESTLCCFLQE